MLTALIITAILSWNSAIAGLPVTPQADPAMAELFAELPAAPFATPLERFLRNAEDLEFMEAVDIDLSKVIADCGVTMTQCICQVPPGCVYVHTENSCGIAANNLPLCPQLNCRIKCPGGPGGGSTGG